MASGALPFTGGSQDGRPVRLVIQRQIGLITPRGIIPSEHPLFTVIEELTSNASGNITARQLVEIVQHWVGE